MFKPNGTVFMPSLLTLIGIPGLESVHFWIEIPFCAVYIIALFDSSLLLLTIKSERSLHEPMYLFLAMLGMWLIHTFQSPESGILLAMALDSYVAICDPLRHSTVFTHQLLTQIGVGVTLRAALLVAPCLILIKCRLKYCWTTVVSHSYCEHTAMLAAEDIQINKTYGLFVAFSILGLDITFITPSYIRIFVTVFNLPQKEARLKAFNTCIAHISVFLEFYLLAFFSFFTHRFGFHIPPYILLSNLYLLVPPLLNPVVYGVKNKHLRSGRQDFPL
ncbi:Olfactory Receptor 52A1 [Manis pentadactyla]|nr:Olfactory Receptor 52A1 [Manis pentadactyla]